MSQRGQAPASGRPDDGRGESSTASDGTGEGAVTVVLQPGDPANGVVDLRQVVACVLGGARTLVVDASRIDHLSSTVITALLWAQRRCGARGGSVVVRDPSRRSLEMLVRTGLKDVLDVERAGSPAPGATPTTAGAAW